MKIAVLDTGINTAIGGKLYKYSDKIKKFIKTDDGISETKSENTDNKFGHGTGVCSILLNNSINAELYVFKVFEDSLISNVNIIIEVLYYIYEQTECKIVQMSFGVRNYSSELYNICKKLSDKGVIIISAFDNGGGVSFPAAFDCVLGVDGSGYLLKGDMYYCSQNSIVDIFAKAGRQRVVSNDGKDYVISEGNSYAASYVTILIKSICDVEENISINAVRQKLLLNSSKNFIFSPNDTEDQMDFGRTIAFPCNKEISNLIKYADMLSINLVDVYDVKYTGRVGNVFTSFNGKNQYIIKNIDKCIVDTFDTMVIGHLRELGNILNRNLKKEILEYCLNNNKNAYCLDDTDTVEYSDIFKEKGLQLFYPLRNRKYISTKVGKLYQLATPNLLILGTNKKQGKFTFQMQIKNLLEKRGYKVGLISTEPTGKLFGGACMFPYGYEGVYTPDDVMSVEYVNEKVFEMDKYHYDLNIIGFQSCFLPRNFYNKGETDLNSISILYATQPDAAILVIDYNDSLEFIERNIYALKALTNTDVIAIALNKFNAVYDYEIDSLKKELTKTQVNKVKMDIMQKFNLETFLIGNQEQNDDILEVVEKYFSE